MKIPVMVPRMSYNTATIVFTFHNPRFSRDTFRFVIHFKDWKCMISHEIALASQ